jgi:hypothetical protein
MVGSMRAGVAGRLAGHVRRPASVLAGPVRPSSLLSAPADAAAPHLCPGRPGRHCPQATRTASCLSTMVRSSSSSSPASPTPHSIRLSSESFPRGSPHAPPAAQPPPPHRAAPTPPGLHYDALAVAAFEGAPEELDVTLFEAGSATGQAVMAAAEKLVAATHAARQFTDTANFTLRCGVCQMGLKVGGGASRGFTGGGNSLLPRARVPRGPWMGCQGGRRHRRVERRGAAELTWWWCARPARRARRRPCSTPPKLATKTSPSIAEAGRDSQFEKA